MLNENWAELLLSEPESDRPGILRSEDAQIYFEVADPVRFYSPDTGMVNGIVVKLNPKRASVWCDTENWAVPYGMLHHECKSTAKDRRARGDRLRKVAVQARTLMDRHGLEDWTLLFSPARRTLGQCDSRRKRILLSRHHAVMDPPMLVTDTILHEIAHALAGHEAGHGPAWKAIARRVGATPKSCRDRDDSALAPEAGRAKGR